MAGFRTFLTMMYIVPVNGFILSDAGLPIGTVVTATAAAAFFSILLMPLTFSITNGLAAAFVAYTVIKLARAEFKDLNIGIITIALISLIVFIVHG
jgi:AGZA family xanthine/uracil permease-like MFS transporter